MSKIKLREFEKKADDLASKLAVLSYWSFNDLFGLFFNNVYYLSDVGRKKEAGDLCSRLSYLPALLDTQAKVSSTPELDKKQLSEEWENLIQYLHFCELMPQVHKGYFEVDGDESAGFHLQHKNKQLSDYEIRDILMADLARPFYTSSSTQVKQSIDQISVGEQSHKFPCPNNLIRERINFCNKHLHDLFQIPDSVYKDVFNVDREEFNRFRCYMFALSDCKESIRSCVKAQVFPPAQKDLQKEMIMQLTYCFLSEESLLYEIHKYTELSKQKIFSLMDLFTLDMRTFSSNSKAKNKHSSDGYLPPIAKSDRGYYFSPVAIKSFLSSRNFLFALQKKDVSKFNSVISGSFEPEMISRTVAALSSISGLEVRQNHEWKSSSATGEIDLLVYCSNLNKALVIQAKAVIPPQGARMVRNVQDRILEGIEQIVRFNELSKGERGRIISEALGFYTSDVETVDIILSSSCLGSDKAWVEIDKLNICGINSVLLRLLIYESIQAKDSSILFNIQSWTKETLDKLVDDSKIQWEDKEFKLFGVSVCFPSWSIDESSLHRTRMRIVKALEALPNSIMATE